MGHCPNLDPIGSLRSMTMQTTTPAGWYPEGTQLRWWDGTQWTDQYAPNPASLQVTQQQAVTMPRKMYKTSHGFHLIMSIITVGLWVPVWIIVGIYNAAKS